MEGRLILDKYLIRVIFQRVVEMLLGCILPSVLICALCVSGPMPVGSIQRDITLFFAPIAFIVWNFRTLRRCYKAFAGEIIYYHGNICAYGIFAILNLLAYFILPTDGYTWIFVITRFLRYSSIGITSQTGIMLFNLLLFASIFFAPIGLGWIKMVEKENEELLERVPGNLEVNPLEQKAYTEVHMDESKDKETKNSVSRL